MADWKVSLYRPRVGAAEAEAVAEVIRSGWLSNGPVTRRFEEEFAAAAGVEDSVAVSNGTAALHLAFLALGVGPGDEVVLPSLSFVSAAAVVTLCGATPVFADVSGPHDLGVSPSDVAARVTDRTRAIVAMHYGGHAADLPALAELARRHGVALVEDSAHAPATMSEHGVLGTVGDIGCYSFFATKNLAMGEGGAVVARDVLLESLPKVVAKDAGAPPNSAVVVDVNGPLEFMRTVRVDAEGRGTVDGSVSLGPAVTLATDWETYMRLACGRVRPSAVSERLKIEGDQKLADAILAHFAVTP